MSNKYLGQDIPKLGFGAMRLPTLDDPQRTIDLDQVKKMVDTYLERGFRYFDTAYGYHGGKSETTLRDALVKRYPRSSYYLADKMPLWEVKSTEDYPRLFAEQLERTGAEYFDFYLLHNLSGPQIEATETFGGWDFMKRMKAEGKVKHIGFSFHDKADRLNEILTKHPETEFVQLQINYNDWDDEDVQSGKCYEVARRHGKAVIIMEPIKGGALAGFSPEIRKIFTDANPELSVASWAVRYAASLDGLVTVLSGMSNLEQLLDNTSYMVDFQPLSPEEHAVINRVTEEIKKIPTIPCTSCEYCIDDCPSHINIPGVISALNNNSVYDNLAGAKGHYGFITSRGGKASDCIACANCEGHCPQHIEIIEAMKTATSLFE